MGSHFSPQGDTHGLPDAPQDEIHLGDLGNIEVKDDGTGNKEITLARANLKDGDSMSLLGKALVIHQDKDKGASQQPSGGSGKPIACGVIKKG
jgi:Cu-Zn family superoxide dismutase